MDATVDLGGSSLFGLTTTNGFHAQSSGTEPTSDQSVALTALGNLGCSSVTNRGQTFRNVYKYCGTALGTALGALVTAFGSVLNTTGKLVDSLELSFSASGDRQATVTVGGHQHTTNPHSATTNPPNTFDVSALIPAGAGLGVPNIFGVTSTAGSASSASLRFSFNHIDKVGATGVHFVGESITCRVEGSSDFEGVITTAGIVTTTWLDIKRALSDSNVDLDTSSITAHAYVDAS